MRKFRPDNVRLEDLVLLEDDSYVFLNKPPFLSSLEDRNDAKNVLSLVRATYPEAHIGHRLDKNTSGCMVIAKNDATYRHVATQFEGREVRKIYHAVIDGVHQFQRMGLEAPIREKSAGKGAGVQSDGKMSLTEFNTIQQYRSHTLVECIPHTGRLHQIRVHLAHLGAPVAGDIKYGGKDILLSDIKRNYRLSKHREESPLIRRFALHAKSISFRGTNDESYSVEAPYPKDFAVLLKQLDRYARR